MVVRRQILRLSFHCSAFTFSNIRHFTPLRMTKCAAEYRWRRCPKVCGEQVSRLGVPNIDHLTANDKDFSLRSK